MLTRSRARRTLAFILIAVGVLAGGAGGQVAPKGLDVSHWQGPIDWLQVGASGYGFIFVNATDGTTYADGTFLLNQDGAHSVGARVGAYHFARPAGGSDAAIAASAIGQADWFLSYARPQPGDLLPALDLEKTGNLSASQLTAWTQAWLDEIVARLGVKPLVYASPNFWKTALGDTPVFATAGHQLWIANWTKSNLPILPGGGWAGLGWTFWQWTNCAHVSGILRCVDGDRLNGVDLNVASIPALPSGAPIATVAPAVVGTPQAGQPLAATAGGWGGGKPVSFSYQWQTCDAVGAGCVPISGANNETYMPKPADVGHAIVVAVTAETSGGTAQASSAPTLAVAGSGAQTATAPRATSAPTIQGSAQVGQRLGALVGTWTGAPTSFVYQWRRCAGDGSACVVIPGAGGRGYTITPDDIGAALSLVVIATGRGGSRSARAIPTAAVASAPVPTPAIATTVAQAGQAGAVTTLDQSAIATWQPGAVPAQATIRLAASSSRLALTGTSLLLSVDAPIPLRWPIDLQYASAPADAVPGFLRGTGVWKPIPQLPTALLPTDQETGAYRDEAGVLHVLTRDPGRLALFAPGKWGDPRYVPSTRPTLTLTDGPSTVTRSGTTLILGRITLDSQAHLYAGIVAPDRTHPTVRQEGSRLGWWLHGKPTKLVQTLQLQPGALPVRISVPATQLRTSGRYTLRITAIDPYGRHSRLLIAFTPSR